MSLDIEQIRSATLEDAADLSVLWQACGLTRQWNDPKRDIESGLSTPTSTILVLPYSGELIASTMVGFDGHRGWFYYLAVSPRFQNRGLGRQVVSAGENWLSQNGAWKINLMIRAENKAVERFYQNLGYISEKRIVMGKVLPDANED